MIEPRTTPRERVKISTYDFEWKRGVNWEVLRRRADGSARRVKRSFPEISLCGFYDERGYWATTNIEEFATRLFTPANCGRRIYAHFGGASDLVFLLRPLVKRPEFRCKGVFSGSACIYLRVERGDHVWELLDSFWTMRVPLAKIGSWVGEAKLVDVDPETCSPAELVDRNESDCRILYNALHQFQTVIWDRGGTLRVTAASTALDLFLRRYLKRKIRNSNAVDEFCMPGYVAARVEPIRERCERGYVYDIKSSFPTSMTRPLPGSPIGAWRKSIPSGEGKLWAARVTVTTPEDEYLPAVPYRPGYRDNEKRVFFPTGTFETTINNYDLEAGGFRIEKVHTALEFEPFDDMAEFALDLFELRKKARHGFEGPVFKIVLNSLYGKWAEREEKTGLLIRPDSRDLTTQHMLFPGCYVGVERVDVPHTHVPLSMFITAASRTLLLESILRPMLRGGRIYYCDTDSGTGDIQLPEGDELGELEKVAEIRDGVFYAPKLYTYLDEQGIATVKAKGFSRKVDTAGKSTRLTYQDFLRVIDGRSMRIERMLRLRELLRGAKDRNGMYLPEVIESDKALSFTQRPKRCKLPDGDSRPWTVDECSAPWEPPT